MNLNDYEKKYFSIYESFAETVRFILKKALLSADNLPRPQSIQCRPKGIDSLRRRLSEECKLDTQTLELDRRDLAGARLIFYTNNDVDRFRASSLIHENFEIEDDSTRIHQPTIENKETRYRAVHYTVRLRKDRIRLPEYARFAGLRCEIQVQTILEHAWSETSHDPIYKAQIGDGYGTRAMESITGVVSGEFGFAEAWRHRKESLAEWMADERPAVKAFAEKHIAELDLMIASEQRRAEAEREMRNRSYDEEDDESEGPKGT